MNGLKIEWGVIINLRTISKKKQNKRRKYEVEEEKKEKQYEEDVKSFSDQDGEEKHTLMLKGKLLVKAFGLIFNHPAVIFERK